MNRQQNQSKHTQVSDHSESQKRDSIVGMKNKNANHKKNLISPGSKDGRHGTHGRGFASMDPQRQREIASMGGKAAHEKGTAHEFTSEEARIAGRKGGEAVSRDRGHMAEIGAEGGRASHSSMNTSRGHNSLEGDAYEKTHDTTEGNRA